MNEETIRELIASFIEYRKLMEPLGETLQTVSRTYGEIREDLDNLAKNFSPESIARLERVHGALNVQAGKGQELSRKIDEYAASGERYAKAVENISSDFSKIGGMVAALEESEQRARTQIERIESLIDEKKTGYNIKDLQKSLDKYNVNIEKITEFINKDIATVMAQNAEKIDSIRRENEELSKVVAQQNRDIATLTAMFAETTAFLKKAVEGSTVNEQYLFDAFDKWAADRKVKTKKK